ncbi:MAG TPA: lytic transglycosylase domain-containing protein, partial [Trebonia sp.]
VAARQAAERKAVAARAAAAEAAAPPTRHIKAVSPSGTPQQVAEQLLSQFGWSAGQFACLQPLWERESGWDVTAENPSSGAYGIPQALPGAQMASAGPNWQTNAATQIRWGLTYIEGRYGSPCGAWAHEGADGWY